MIKAFLVSIDGDIPAVLYPDIADWAYIQRSMVMWDFPQQNPLPKPFHLGATYPTNDDSR
ncbi:hypothetical protein HZS_6646, partial [Henneguya salminicola]